MSFSLSGVYKSLVRHTVETIAASASVSPTLQYYAWDSRGEENELAGVDLLGLAGWTFRENRGLWVIHVGLTLSTINDENLLREAEIIDIIHDLWGEECAVPMLDSTGAEYTQLVVKEFEMLPAGTSEKRNFRPIGLELKRTSA